MQAAAKSSCACNCHPCACPSPTGLGCLPEACPPRPCFFNGQLITADDLNAMMTYLRTRDAIFARMVSGWGVLGGLRLNAGPGVRSTPLANPQLSPNPQILAGTTRDRAGMAIACEAACSRVRPTIIDVQARRAGSLRAAGEHVATGSPASDSLCLPGPRRVARRYLSSR